MHVIRYICKTCSIRNILFSFLLVFAIIPTLIVYFCFKSFTMSIVADKYINEYLMSLSSQIDYMFSAYEDQLNTGYLRIALIPDKIRRINNNDNVEKLMSDAFSSEEAISYAEIVTPNGVYTYSPDGNIYNFHEKIDKKYTESFNNMGFKIMNSVFKTDDKNYVVAGQNLYNYYNSRNIGYILFYTNETYITDLYKNLQTDNMSCLIALGDHILSSENKDLIGKDLYIPESSVHKDSSDPTHTQRFKIKSAFDGNLSVVSIISNANLFDIIQALDKFNTVMLFVSMLLALIVSIVISRNCLKSISRVNRNIMLFAENPNDYIPQKCNGEIASFENQFNEMVVKIKELMKKNEYERERKHIAELCTLQSQIKHHFVYNALDIVYWKARENNQPQIEKIILALASYFRTSLSRGSNFITIREEISLVKNYLFIEQMRFEDMFEAEFDIAEDILDTQILKIILQPIVENCIKHGFKDIDYKGKILVSGKRSDNDTIVFDVIDNGHGMKEDIAEASFENRSDKIGYGLYNIYERLHFEYGEESKLNFINTNGKGTHVQLVIKTKKDQTKKIKKNSEILL